MFGDVVYVCVWFLGFVDDDDGGECVACGCWLYYHGWDGVFVVVACVVCV